MSLRLHVRGRFKRSEEAPDGLDYRLGNSPLCGQFPKRGGHSIDVETSLNRCLAQRMTLRRRNIPHVTPRLAHTHQYRPAVGTNEPHASRLDAAPARLWPNLTTILNSPQDHRADGQNNPTGPDWPPLRDDYSLIAIYDPSWLTHTKIISKSDEQSE